jgi:hypothetical protein
MLAAFADRVLESSKDKESRQTKAPLQQGRVDAIEKTMTQGLPYWVQIKSPLDRAMRQTDAEANVSAACNGEPQGEEQHACGDATKDESAS